MVAWKESILVEMMAVSMVVEKAEKKGQRKVKCLVELLVHVKVLAAVVWWEAMMVDELV